VATQLVWRVHEFIAQSHVYGQPLSYPPVILAIEAKGIVDEIPIFIGKGGGKLHNGGYALQEIRKLIELDLPIKGVGGLTSKIVPIEQYSKLEGMFSHGTNSRRRSKCKYSGVERLGGGVDGTELSITVTPAPIHIDNACRKAWHEGGTQTTVGKADVRQVRGAARATERKPRSVNYRSREDVILSQRNPLVSRGYGVAEVGVVALGLILKRIVNGIAGKERVCGGEIVVYTHLPVIFSKAVMIVASLNRPNDQSIRLREAWLGLSVGVRSPVKLPYMD